MGRRLRRVSRPNIFKYKAVGQFLALKATKRIATMQFIAGERQPAVVMYSNDFAIRILQAEIHVFCPVFFVL